jgi:hypothetical protein
MGTWRQPFHIRLGYEPNYSKPIPVHDEWGRIDRYDHLTSTDLEPAIVLALDVRRGDHAVVTRTGWSVQPSNTHFVADSVQQSLPEPAPISDPPETVLDQLRRLLRLSEPAWKTLLAWILLVLRPPQNEAFHSYPILNLIGPENSGKSLTAKLLVHLLDPSGIPLHTLPTTERRLHALAASHRIIAIDDPGKINPEKSRFLSRLASGIASLYPQLEGMVVRPIILTSCEEKHTKHLAGRIVDLELAPIPESELRDPHELFKQLDALRPQLLAALLTLMSQNFDAPAPHLPSRRTKNQKIAQLVTAFLETQPNSKWKGTATELIAAANLPPIHPISLSLLLDDVETLDLHRDHKKHHRLLTLNSIVGRTPSSAPDPWSGKLKPTLP